MEEEGVVGLKFYPYDIYDGAGRRCAMDDPEAVYPILEHAQKRGMRSVAVHKAIAMAGCPIQPFHPRDLEDALLAFPGSASRSSTAASRSSRRPRCSSSYYRNAVGGARGGERLHRQCAAQVRRDPGRAS